MPLKAFSLFVPNRNDNTVTVIDTLNKRILSTIIVGAGPSNIIISSDNKIAISCNTDDNTVSIIDTDTLSVKSNVTVGTSPISGAITPDNKYFFVINKDDGSISKINLASNIVEKSISLSFRPTRMIMKKDGNSIYVAGINSNKVALIDTNSSTISKEIQLPEQPNYVPAALKLTPDEKVLLYVSSSTPMVAGINTETNEVVPPVFTTTSQTFIPQDLVIDPNGQYAYAVGISKNAGIIIKLTATLPLGVLSSKFIFSIPYKVNITSDNKYLITSNTTSKNVFIFNIENFNNYTPIYTGGSPSDIIINPENTIIYISNRGLNEITTIKLDTKTIFTNYPVGQNPASPNGAIINVPVPSYLIVRRPYYTETLPFSLSTNQKLNYNLVLNKIEGNSGIIEGTVTDIYNFPIKGASVFLKTKDGHVFDNMYTLDNGSYSFSLVKMKEPYIIVVSSPDYHYSASQEIIIIPDTITKLDFKLESDVLSSKGVITGNVLNGSNEPLGSAIINIYMINLGNTPILNSHGVTNSFGEFYLSLLDRGAYSVTINKPNYLPVENVVVIDKIGQVSTITTLLTRDPSNPSSIISGVIKDISGNILPNINIELYIIEGTKKYLYAEQQSNVNGEYNFTNLKAGTYLLEALKFVNEEPKN